MNPRKPKDMIQEAAEKAGIPYEHMKFMVTGFYSELKRTMRELDGPMVKLNGIGRMQTQVGRVNRELIKAQKDAGKLLSTSVKPEVLDNLDRLLGLKEKQDKEIRKVLDRREASAHKRAKKEKDEAERNNKAGMGEQG